MSGINVPEKKTEETSENKEITPENSQKSLEVSQLSDCLSVESVLNQISPIHQKEVGAGQISSTAILSLSKLIAANVSSYVAITEDHINLTFSFPKSEFGQMSLAVLQQLEKNGSNNTESKTLKSSEIPKSELTSKDDSCSVREDETDMSTETLNRSFLSEIAFRSNMDNCEEILSAYMKENDLNNPERAEASNNNECQEKVLERNSENFSAYSLGDPECKDDMVNSVKLDLKTDKGSENNKRDLLKDIGKNAPKIPLDTLNSSLNTKTCRSQEREETIKNPIEDILNVPRRNSKSDGRNQASVDSFQEAHGSQKSLEPGVDPTRSPLIEFASGKVGCISDTREINEEKENISFTDVEKSRSSFSQAETKCQTSHSEFSPSSSKETDAATTNVDEKETNAISEEDYRNGGASTACIAENNPERKETVTDSITNHKQDVNAPKSQEVNLKSESDGMEILDKSILNSSSEMAAIYIQQEQAKIIAANAICNKHLSKAQSFSEDKSTKSEDAWPEILPFTEIQEILIEEIKSRVSTDTVAKYFQLKLSDRCIVVKAISKDKNEISLKVAEYRKSNPLNMVKCKKDSSKEMENSEVDNEMNHIKLYTSAEATDKLLPSDVAIQCEPLNTHGISNESLEAATEVDTDQRKTTEQVVSKARTFSTSGKDLDTEEQDKVFSERIITGENKRSRVSSEIISDNGHSEINVTDINASQSPKKSSSGLFHGPTDKKSGEPGSPVKEIKKSPKTDLRYLAVTDSERQLSENFTDGIISTESRTKCITQVSSSFSTESVLNVDSKEMLEKNGPNVFERSDKTVDEVSSQKHSTYDMDVTKRIGSDSEIGLDETLVSVSDITHSLKYTSPTNTSLLLRGTASCNISKSGPYLENPDIVQSSFEETSTVSKSIFREVSHTSTPNIAGKRLALQSTADVSDETSEGESFFLEMSESHSNTKHLSTVITERQSIVESSSVVDKNVIPDELSHSSIIKNKSVHEQSNEDSALGVASSPATPDEGASTASSIHKAYEYDSLASSSIHLDKDCDGSLPHLADEHAPASTKVTESESASPLFSLADENGGPALPLSLLPNDAATSSVAADEGDAASSVAADEGDAASSMAASSVEDDEGDAASSMAASSVEDEGDTASSVEADEGDAASSVEADKGDKASSVAAKKLKNGNAPNESRFLSTPLESNDARMENGRKIKSSAKGKRTKKQTNYLSDEVDLAPTRARLKNQTFDLPKHSIPENSAVTKCEEITSRVSFSIEKTCPGKRNLRSKSLDPSPTKTRSKDKSSSRDKKLISVSGKTPLAAAENEAVMRIKRTETSSKEDINPTVRSSPRKATRATAASGRSASLEPQERPKQLRSGEESTSAAQSTKSRSSASTTLLSLSARRSKRGTKE